MLGLTYAIEKGVRPLASECPRTRFTPPFEGSLTALAPAWRGRGYCCAMRTAACSAFCAPARADAVALALVLLAGVFYAGV